MNDPQPTAGTLADEDLAAVMRALGHPVRLSILRLLAARRAQCCCMDVTEALPLAQSTVSQHIKVLLEAGLVERHPAGTRNRYCLCGSRLAALEDTLGGLLGALAGDEAPPPRARSMAETA